LNGNAIVGQKENDARNELSPQFPPVRHSTSLTDGVAFPAPVAGGNVGEVQINPVRRHPEGFAQRTANFLRRLPIHGIAQTADAADG
jgi:hypothetical protein